MYKVKNIFIYIFQIFLISNKMKFKYTGTARKLLKRFLFYLVNLPLGSLLVHNDPHDLGDQGGVVLGAGLPLFGVDDAAHVTGQ